MPIAATLSAARTPGSSWEARRPPATVAEKRGELSKNLPQSVVFAGRIRSPAPAVRCNTERGERSRLQRSSAFMCGSADARSRSAWQVRRPQQLDTWVHTPRESRHDRLSRLIVNWHQKLHAERTRSLGRTLGRGRYKHRAATSGMRNALANSSGVIPSCLRSNCDGITGAKPARTVSS
jgi:hypothetical protein